MKIKVFDRGEMLQMYLDYFNNFLTVPRFAEYYGISEEFANQVIDIGRETLNNQLSEGKFIEVRHENTAKIWSVYRHYPEDPIMTEEDL